MRLDGQQLGFIPAHVSREGDPSGLAFRMDQGSTYQCRIANLTGGGPGENLGVNIEITEGEKFEDMPQFRRSKAVTPGAREVQPAVVWVLAVIIIGCVLWAAFK